MSSNLQRTVSDLGNALHLAFAPLGKVVEGVLRTFAEIIDGVDTLKALRLLAEAELEATPRWRLLRRHKLRQFIRLIERKQRERLLSAEMRDAFYEGFTKGLEQGVDLAGSTADATSAEKRPL